jgi:hypothetical protein
MNLESSYKKELLKSPKSAISSKGNRGLQFPNGKDKVLTEKRPNQQVAISMDRLKSPNLRAALKNDSMIMVAVPSRKEESHPT